LECLPLTPRSQTQIKKNVRLQRGKRRIYKQQNKARKFQRKMKRRAARQSD
jgi:hypothetical protein